jgi:short-subunit dehydrogenase
MIGQKIAVVTGASSGIGRAIAQELASNGYRVFGTVRSSAVELPQEVEQVILDVRDEALIGTAVRQIVSLAKRIDVLVNNAGKSLVGAIEEADIAQAQALFDTNFFGAVRVTQAILPVMRAQRSGRIVFIGSIVGFLPTPFMGFYSASKHAIEGYSESLDHEVRKMGIRSIVIEPGFMKTRIDQNSVLAARKIQDYAQDLARSSEYARSAMEKADDPSLVARKLLVALRAAHPRLHYPVGRGAAMLGKLRRFMPESLFDRNLRAAFHLDA